MQYKLLMCFVIELALVSQAKQARVSPNSKGNQLSREALNASSLGTLRTTILGSLSAHTHTGGSEGAKCPQDSPVANPFPNQQDDGKAFGACLTQEEADKAFGAFIQSLCSLPEGYEQREAQKKVLAWAKSGLDANHLSDGLAPLHRAAQCGLWRTVDTLLANFAAKASVLSSAQCSPMDYAINGANTLVTNQGRRERFLKTMEILVCTAQDKCDASRGCTLKTQCGPQPMGSPTEKFTLPTPESCSKGDGGKHPGSGAQRSGQPEITLMMVITVAVLQVMCQLSTASGINLI